MLGLTVRCAVHTNYKPLYVELELKAALFHGTPQHFSELYILSLFVVRTLYYVLCYILGRFVVSFLSGGTEHHP